MLIHFGVAITHWNIYWLKKPHDNFDCFNIFFPGNERDRLSCFILCKITVIGIWPFWNRLLSITLLDFFSLNQLFKLWLSQKEQQGANRNRIFKWKWKVILYYYSINIKHIISWKSNHWRLLTLELKFSF